jgi:uncharacterized protein (DUF2141 family)
MRHHTLIALLALHLAAPPLMASDLATLSVTIEGIRSDQGEIRLALYADRQGFRNEEQSLRLVTQAAEPGSITLNLPPMPAADYAIIAYHDEDSNGRLNRRFGMFPTEGYGLSANPRLSGPPSFNDARFSVSAPHTAITIQLNY